MMTTHIHIMRDYLDLPQNILDCNRPTQKKNKMLEKLWYYCDG